MDKNNDEINLKPWKDLINEIFESKVPETNEWDKQIDIKRILEKIAEAKIRVYFPNGGEDIFTNVVSGYEPDTLEIQINENYYFLAKPKVLKFFRTKLDQSSYFIMDTGDLPPIENFEVGDNVQEMGQVAPRKFISRIFYDEHIRAYNRHGDPVPLRKKPRLVQRVLKGKFLFVPDSSKFHSQNIGDTGIHNKIEEDELLSIINSLK